MKPKKPKKRMCKLKGCRVHFWPRNSFDRACGLIHALELVEQDKTEKTKKQKSVDKLKLLALKPRGYWIAKAQTECNRFVRERDKDLPCIMCGKTDNELPDKYGGKWDACHFQSRGHSTELRFHPMNIHKGCKSCNSPGPIKATKTMIWYRKNLIKKIGLYNVEWLEGPHELQRLGKDEIKEVEEWYKKLYKEIS